MIYVITIDHIDYVTRIGNSSREQYSQLGQSVSHEKSQKLRKKNTKNGQKSHIFLILLTIATKQKHLEAYNLAILVDKAFFQLCFLCERDCVCDLSRKKYLRTKEMGTPPLYSELCAPTQTCCHEHTQCATCTVELSPTTTVDKLRVVHLRIYTVAYNRVKVSSCKLYACM